MNKEYLKWMREVRANVATTYFSETFWSWMRGGYFRKMFLEGESPDGAVHQLIPF